MDRVALREAALLQSPKAVVQALTSRYRSSSCTQAGDADLLPKDVAHDKMPARWCCEGGGCWGERPSRAQFFSSLCADGVNCYGPTTYEYSARIPTCRLRTTADAVYVTACLHYRAQGEVGRVAEDGLRVGARDGGGDGGEVVPIEGPR